MIEININKNVKIRKAHYFNLKLQVQFEYNLRLMLSACGKTALQSYFKVNACISPSDHQFKFIYGIVGSVNEIHCAVAVADFERNKSSNKARCS